jgi:pSer/pThr/pTyr-binding forkhead associated (FHA) protein
MQDTYYLRRVSDGARFALKTAMRVGTREDSEVRLQSEYASRFHALITLENGVPWLEDKSRNGTFVDDKRITGKHRLLVGEIVRFLDEAFEVLVGAGTLPGASVDPQRTVTISDYIAQDDDLPDIADISEPTLVVLTGQQKGKRFPLQGTSWTLGSGPDCAMRLSDEGVSTLHATLSRRGKSWKLQDEIATNGTFVGGEKISICYLNNNDIIALGARAKCLMVLPGAQLAAQVQGRARGRWYIAAIAVAVLIVLGVFAYWWLR